MYSRIKPKSYRVALKESTKVCCNCLPLPAGVWRYTVTTYCDFGWCKVCQCKSNIVEKFSVILYKQDWQKFKKYLADNSDFKLRRTNDTKTS